MKALALILALISPMAYADNHAFCMRHAEVAKAIMGGRQMGMPITDFAKGMENPIIRQQIMRAYQRPLWATDRMKDRERAEFESSEYMLCMNGGVDLGGM